MGTTLGTLQWSHYLSCLFRWVPITGEWKNDHAIKGKQEVCPQLWAHSVPALPVHSDTMNIPFSQNLSKPWWNGPASNQWAMRVRFTEAFSSSGLIERLPEHVRTKSDIYYVIELHVFCILRIHMGIHRTLWAGAVIPCVKKYSLTFIRVQTNKANCYVISLPFTAITFLKQS